MRPAPTGDHAPEEWLRFVQQQMEPRLEAARAAVAAYRRDAATPEDRIEASRRIGDLYDQIASDYVALMLDPTGLVRDWRLEDSLTRVQLVVSRPLYCMAVANYAHARQSDPRSRQQLDDYGTAFVSCCERSG